MTTKMVDRWLALPAAVTITAYVVIGVGLGLLIRMVP